MATKKYRNKFIFNQRGGSLSIDNTTDQEKIQMSHRSGSNIELNNLINSELASNNKQTFVTNDEFKTVANNYSEYINKHKTQRVAGDSYNLKGFAGKSNIDAFEEWKALFTPFALINSQFKILRGGYSDPNGGVIPQLGERNTNPVVGQSVFTVQNKWRGYINRPAYRTSGVDQVASYQTVPDHGETEAAKPWLIEVEHVDKAAGEFGSRAPGVLEFGAEVSAATEGGLWESNTAATTFQLDGIGQLQHPDVQKAFTDAELKMGDGGDEHVFVKRNKIETIGAAFNDLPSVRIDPKGRSQPFECLMGDPGVFKNHDYAPHVEEVDNSSNFPCGQDVKIVGNTYERVVGSGGISLKTTGHTELGGETLKTGFAKINMNASHGIHIASESGVEIQSLKSIVLRTNRQVYVECALGVRTNAIIGGGLAVEGETYVQHITAPLEVQQTEDTVVAGKFATDRDRTLFIGECEIGGDYYPVYALADHNLMVTYPHSHHFNNLPLTLCTSNLDVRKFAQKNGINTHCGIAQAIPQIHEKKLGQGFVPQP